MSEYFGIDQGDAALAAFYLDPKMVLGKLDVISKTAYTSGMGKTMGLDIDKELAERVAQLPKSEAGITQDLQQAASMAALYTESFGETDDLTGETGVRSVSLGDAGATNSLNCRAAERSAVNRASVGGAALTSEGVVGLS